MHVILCACGIQDDFHWTVALHYPNKGDDHDNDEYEFERCHGDDDNERNATTKMAKKGMPALMGLNFHMIESGLN